MKDKQNDKKSADHARIEEEAAYHYEVVWTPLGYMTQKEYDEEIRPEIPYTEEDYKRMEEVNNMIADKDDMEQTKNEKTFKSKVTSLFQNFKPKLPKKSRDMDKDR